MHIVLFFFLSLCTLKKNPENLPVFYYLLTESKNKESKKNPIFKILYGREKFVYG